MPVLLKYSCDQCERSFIAEQGLRMHKIRAHGKGWDTSRNFGKGGKKKYRYPSDDPAYKRAYYAKKKQQSLAIKKGIAKRKALNGAVAAPIAATDPLGDAAKAILVAAKVLRGTMTAFKLPLVILGAFWLLGCSDPSLTRQKTQLDIFMGCMDGAIPIEGKRAAFEDCSKVAGYKPVWPERGGNQ